MILKQSSQSFCQLTLTYAKTLIENSVPISLLFFLRLISSFLIRNKDSLTQVGHTNNVKLVWVNRSEVIIHGRLAYNPFVSLGVKNWVLCSFFYIIKFFSYQFRIWDTKRWTPERWCARGQRVVAACWGPKDILLFAAKGEPMVFALTNTSLMSGKF